MALFRVEDAIVERYEGSDHWVEPPGAGRVLMGIIGMGGGWANYVKLDLKSWTR